MLSNFLRLEETIARLVDDGNIVDAVYLGFGKAFDWVDHRFLSKLESCDLCKQLLDGSDPT